MNPSRGGWAMILRLDPNWLQLRRPYVHPRSMDPEPGISLDHEEFFS